MALALLALLGITLPASAQVEVSATLDLTDGWARAEAYVPVRLKITNHLGGDIEGISVSSGGPVETVVPWRIASDQTDAKVVPVYYAGGDLRLMVIPDGSFPTRDSPAAVATPTVRPLTMDEALVAIAEGLPEPDEAARRMLAERLRVQSLRIVRMSKDVLATAVQCGAIDAIVCDARADAFPSGRAMVVRIASTPAADKPQVQMGPAFPAGAEAAVQPETYRLLASESWPAESGRLWLWLGVFSLAAAVTAALVPRRRMLVAAAALVGLAAVAGVLIWLLVDPHAASLRQARVFYAAPSHTGRMAGLALVEHFTAASTRSAAVMTPPFGVNPAAPLPLPVLPSSEAILGTQMILRLGENPQVQPMRSQVLIHTLAPAAPPLALGAESIRSDTLSALARRPDVIAALLVEEDRATDASGRTQTARAWAVEWKSSDDEGLAYAGRSLAWWDKARREGDKPALLAWFADPASSIGDKERPRRLPALFVYAGL